MTWLLLIAFTQGGSTEKMMQFYSDKTTCIIEREKIKKHNSSVIKVEAECVDKVPKHD